MPTEASPPQRSSHRLLLALGSLAILAIVALAGLWTLSQRTGDGEIALSPGGVTISFKRNDSLIELVDRALTEKPEAFAGLLSQHDIYALDDERWVGRLRGLGPAGIDPGVRDGLRQLLYDLAGPFALPDTLAHADVRLLDAIQALDAALGAILEGEPVDPELQANAFFAELVRQHLDREGVFARRTFQASVVLRHNVEADAPGEMPVAYVCLGSELRGRELEISLDEPGRPNGLVLFEVREDARVPCPRHSQTVARFLARQPARIDVSAAALARLHGQPEAGSTLPNRVSATVEVIPNNYRPRVKLPDSAALPADPSLPREVRHDL